MQDIAVSWLLEDGSLAGPVFHDIAHYAGVVPTTGDVVAVKLGKEMDAVQVIERYMVDMDGAFTWHLIFKQIGLPTSRLAVLRCANPNPEDAARTDFMKRQLDARLEARSA